MARAQTFTGANGAALATLEGDNLIWLGAVGENLPRTGDRWSLAGSFAKLCLGRKTRPQRCDDVEVDGRVDAAFRGLHAKSLALAPVHDAGKVTGILAVFSGNSRAFNGMHTAVLQTEADGLAELVQQARQAAGVQGEKRKEEPPPEEKLRPAEPQPVQVVALAPPPPAPPEPKPAAIVPQPVKSPEREFEALESAFVLVPPPVAAPPPAPAAEVAPPPVTAALAGAPEAAPAAVPTPPPAATATPAPVERPTLPGFMPLSATAAALAKAKPIPTPPDLLVDAKVRKPVTSVGVPTPPPAPVAVPTPPPAFTAVPTPPPAPAALPTPAPAPAVKFVPLAKPASKTPPPGSLPSVAAPAGASAAKAVSGEEEKFLPAAADPFAHHAPVHVRPPQTWPRPDVAPARPTLANLEVVGRRSHGSAWRLPLLVAAVAAVGLGILWFRTRSHAARSQPASAVTQAAPTPVATPQPAPPASTPESPAAATPTPAAPTAAETGSAATAVATPAEGSRQIVTAQPSSSPVKTQAPAAGARPTATVAAPAGLEVRTPAPVAVPLTTRSQEPAPKTLLSLPAAAPAKLPDLPKPQAPAANLVRQASTPVPAQLLQSVPPVYPAAAKSLRLEGVVRLTAKVSAEGRVTDVVWVSGNSFFKDSALSAVRRWRYQPASLDGQPVESTVEIVLKFTPQ
ncbi:MAG TPA: TonB family protein [Terriglobales bacterium]|nr:TonB family protein [Terriglobales bacterium]